MRPNILKDKEDLIEEVERLNRDIAYYRGKCEAYEFVVMKLKLVEKE